MSGQDEETAVPEAITADAKEITHEEVTELAYRIWQSRGCPEGSAEEDWFAALSQLQSNG
jgi:hypothetical protein